MRASLGLAFVLLALLTALVSTGPAAAQDAEVGAGEDDEYRRLLEEAIAEYDAGRYAEARALFRRAHERSPNARTLRGIGMAAFEMREYAEALRALTAALVEDDRPLTDAQRAHVQSLIDRTNAYVGRYRVSLSPAEVELFVDHAPAPLGEDGTLVLSLGGHSVEARCAGCETQRRRIEVRGGEREELRFVLATRAASQPDEADRTDSVLPPREPAPASDGEGASTGAIVLIATAGVLAAGAIASVFWWLDRNGELDVCREGGAACTNGDTLESERGLAAGATVVFAAGALVLGTIGLLALDGDDESEVPVACAPSFGGMSCAAQF